MNGMNWRLAPVVTAVAVAISTALGSFAQPSQEYYVVPLSTGGVLVQDFDRPDHRWLPGHRGVDFAATVGQEVLSPAAGKVTFAGWVVNRPVITITHHDGLRSSFEPVSSQLPVGSVVEAGEVLGELSAAHSHCAATCLHWGLRAPQPGDEYLDPLHYLAGGGPITLLPLVD